MIRSTPQIRERERQQREWTVEVELLAQLVEEVSILAAERRRRKPREIPRPDYIRAKDSGKGIAHAVGVLKNAAKRVYR